MAGRGRKQFSEHWVVRCGFASNGMVAAGEVWAGDEARKDFRFCWLCMS